MSSLLRQKLKRLSLFVLTFVVLCGTACLASAQTTSADTSSPQDLTAPYAGKPLKPGALTLEDVIEAHTPKKNNVLDPQNGLSGVGASAPLLATSPVKQSSEGSMLMQGMKSVLQVSGTSPQISVNPSSAAVSPDSAFVASTSAPAPASMQYQPGQGPKNLADSALGAVAGPAGAPMTANTASTNFTDLSPASSASASSMNAPGMQATPGCTPHLETWTKTCADAGYPDTFTGNIKGETRSTCPGGSLEDVWVSNTCSPPGEEKTAGTSPTNTDTGAINSAMPSADPTGGATSASSSTNAPLAALSGLSSSSSSVAMSTTARVDAGCGAASGLAVTVTPTSELCAVGTLTEVSGSGPWRWSCNGANGGITVSCAAPVDTTPHAPPPTPPTTIASAIPIPSGDMTPQMVPAPSASPVAPEPAQPRITIDGVCGAANGVAMTMAPAADLCAKGSESRVSGAGPWTWACSGMNGGVAAACTASKKADGVCGASDGTSNNQMPMTGLCNAGIASAVTGNGPWNWTCAGMNGGEPVTCAAQPKEDAVCGMASLTGHRQTPADSLCSVGHASTVSGGGPWLWTCEGGNGGTQVSCSATVSVAGSCGRANGVMTAKPPVDDLCSAGKATRVSGMGPYTWDCIGDDGGETQSCTAPRGAKGHEIVASAEPVTDKSAHEAVASAAPVSQPHIHSADDLCGAAAELAAFSAPSSDLCHGGDASAVTGDGPWLWSCTDKSGHISDCTTLSPGSMTASPTTVAANSTIAPVPQSSPSLPVAKIDQPPSCGPSAEKGSIEAPGRGLCSLGKASAVRGRGPWDWTCAKGKAKVNCEAPRILDAVCGATSGKVLRATPSANLCREGTATAIQGSGPWLWSCVGTGGGVSTSCSALAESQERVDGVCGASSSAPMRSTPTVNLCDSGVPGAVYGQGPWTWTCSGMNGGIASSCSTDRNVPPAPPPPGVSVNGLCGASNGDAFIDQPKHGLCSSGTTTGVSGDGPWNWNCLGENGGMTVSCTALLQPPAPITGVCGNASGMPTLTTPQSGLCSAGISSAVSGHGPWTWSCSGTNGGGAVACVGPLAGAGGSLPSLVTPSSSEAPAPLAAPSSRVSRSGLVTPRLPRGPLPPITDNGDMPPSPDSFQTAPTASRMPEAPTPDAGIALPAVAPDVPSDAQPLTPPPISGSLKSSPALHPSELNSQSIPVAGNHFVLANELSTVIFAPKSDNMDAKAIDILDKVTEALKLHGDVRITLTAYADVADQSPRDARRLSLSRALAMRDYLTSKGISSSRMDVRALGANVPSGEPDRVDINAN